MRFVMLARNPLLYSHQRLIAAARARGHELDVLNTLHVHMNITSSRPLLRYGGKSVPRYDAVVPRIGASVTHYGLAVLRQFEMLGIYPLNESVAIGRSRDKLRALQILAREGTGMPVTAFAHGPRRALNVINEVGGVPVGEPHIALLERAIDSLEAGLPPLRNFILPSGSRGGSLLHVARSVCRRASRRVVTLANAPDTEISLSIIRYLNRLGDYLFVAARCANVEARAAEVPWQLPAT